MAQKYGTDKVSFLFSPIMVVWFLATPMVGVYNIAKHYPYVFKAFSPRYIFLFFKNNGKHGWLMLGGIVLCITGAHILPFSLVKYFRA
jgi:KUP system potassium uptake protein